MYNGPPQQFPPQPHGPGVPDPGRAPQGQGPAGPPHAPGGPVPFSAAGPTPRRGGTGRVIAITVAATLAVYGLAAGGVWAVTSSSASLVGPEYDDMPTDPCSVPSGSELRAMGASLATAVYSEFDSTCWWSAEFANGARGSLQITYRLPTDEDWEPVWDVEEAEREFAEKRGELVDRDGSEYGSIEVQEARDLDLGDESFVSHFLRDREEPGSRAQVLVRKGEYLMEVSVQEDWENRTGRVDFTVGEEVLISIAERALTRLE